MLSRQITHYPKRAESNPCERHNQRQNAGAVVGAGPRTARAEKVLFKMIMGEYALFLCVFAHNCISGHKDTAGLSRAPAPTVILGAVT